MTVAQLDHTQLIERRANVVRNRLLRTLDRLDQKRHAAVHMAEEVKGLAIPAAGVGAAVVFVLLGVALGVHRAHVRARRAARPFVGLRRALGGLLLPPPPPRPSFLVEALRKAGFALVGVAANELGKVAMKRVAFAADEALPMPALPSRVHPVGG